QGACEGAGRASAVQMAERRGRLSRAAALELLQICDRAGRQAGGLVCEHDKARCAEGEEGAGEGVGEISTRASLADRRCPFRKTAAAVCPAHEGTVDQRRSG